MNRSIRSFRLFILSIALLLIGFKSQASHLYGGDLYYKWISGNTYQITLACYGDCSGGAFPSFHTSIAEVQIYKGLTLDTTIQLPCLDTNGTEVTPVCPTDTGNTACHGGTLPGIKRFIFQTTVTLKGTAPDWVFVFDGNLASSSAGRSGSITNLSSAGTMILLDTLNNVNGPSSSAVFTTIPTPFFCINELANYNPGAVDPDGDSLSFKLVPALTGISSYVTYVAGYQFDKYPISVKAPAMSNFTFDSSTGQLSFTPNAIQRSLVVEQVNKYKNGVLVGTSMREMTVVVITCTSKPPTAGVSNNTGGNIVSSTYVTVCQSDKTIIFHIDPDPDGTNLTATASGLPAGATYVVTGNGTKKPIGVFTWNIATVPPGTYKFFVTLQNDACPLSSKQSQVYIVNVVPSSTMTYKQIEVATCHNKGVFEITSSAGLWSASLWLREEKLDTFTSLTVKDTLVDSLNPDAYGRKFTVYVTDQRGCVVDTSFNIDHTPDISKDTTIIVKPSCYGYTDGSFTVQAYNGAAPLTYHLQGYPDQRNGHYSNIAEGTYYVSVTDTVQCAVNIPVIVKWPDSLRLQTITKPNSCEGLENSGQATVTAVGGTPPYSYLWYTAESQRSAEITGMPNGKYHVLVKDSHNCPDSTYAVIGYEDCCTPYAPSAFTPNGDGLNDRFRVRYKGDMKLISFYIVNRYGQIVYSSVYPDEGWDGKFNGVPQEMGTYYYVIKALCGNKGDNQIELKGNLTLIR